MTVPLDTPDWQREVDHALDPIVNVNNAGGGAINVGSLQVYPYVGLDIFANCTGTDWNLTLTWDDPAFAVGNLWTWIHEMPTQVSYQARIPNRGKRLRVQLNPILAGSTFTQLFVVPTMRNDFGYDGPTTGQQFLASSSGAIGAATTLTVPFNYPYHGPATLYATLLSANGNMRIQYREVNSGAWIDCAGLAFTVGAFQTLACTIPAKICRAVIVNNAAGASTHSLAVVPTFQFA